MGKAVDLVGQRFGRWTVLAADDTGKRRQWRCRCDCGQEKFVPTSNLTCGASTGCRTCGVKSHGHSRHGAAQGTYRIWWAMIQRCRNESNGSWPLYGGRGISVCPQWQASFETFLRDMGVKPPGRSLDRVNNDGPYSPSNCRWATPKEQSHNSRAARWISFNGESKVVSEWARYFGVKIPTLFGRIRAMGEADAMAYSMRRSHGDRP